MAVQKTLAHISVTDDGEGTVTINVPYSDGNGQGFTADAESIASEIQSTSEQHCFDHGILRVKQRYLTLVPELVASGTYSLQTLQDALNSEFQGKTVHLDFGNNSVSSIY